MQTGRLESRDLSRGMAAAVTDADDYRMREKLMEGLSNDGAVVANRLPQRKCSISATATTVAKERIFLQRGRMVQR